MQKSMLLKDAKVGMKVVYTSTSGTIYSAEILEIYPSGVKVSWHRNVSVILPAIWVGGFQHLLNLEPDTNSVPTLPSMPVAESIPLAVSVGDRKAKINKETDDEMKFWRSTSSDSCGKCGAPRPCSYHP